MGYQRASPTQSVSQDRERAAHEAYASESDMGNQAMAAMALQEAAAEPADDGGLLGAAAAELAPHAAGCGCGMCEGGGEEFDDDAQAQAEEKLREMADAEDPDEGAGAENTDDLVKQVSLRRTDDFPRTLGITRLETTAVAPELNINVEENEGRHRARVQATTTTDGGHPSHATPAGEYRTGETITVTPSDTTYVLEKVYVVSPSDQTTTVTAEQEHVDDAIAGFELVLQAAANVVNAAAGEDADAFQGGTEAEAKQAAVDHINGNLHANLAVDYPSLAQVSWSLVYYSLYNLKPDRDEMGWHTYSWELAEDAVDLEENTIRYVVDWTGSNIGSVDSTSHVSARLDRLVVS